MSIKITFTLDKDHEDYEHELEVMNQRYVNYRIVKDLYGEVFRPVLKYSSNEAEIEAFDKVWEQVQKFIDEQRDY